MLLALCLLRISQTKPLLDDISNTSFEVESRYSNISDGLHKKSSDIEENDFESTSYRKRSADPAGLKNIWNGIKEDVEEVSKKIVEKKRRILESDNPLVKKKISFLVEKLNKIDRFCDKPIGRYICCFSFPVYPGCF